jgi:hypothetical protein
MNIQAPKSTIKIDFGDVFLSLIVFLIAIFLFGRTLTPGLLPGDGGEFQTMAYLYGHTHPTGYPVYLTLARLFTFLPLGDLAFRVNLFSAVMAAVAVTGVYYVGRLLTSYRFVPAAAALALAVSPSFWSQSIIAEIYSTGAAFLVLILLTLLWWDRFESPRALWLAGMLGGLSLGVHLSVALVAPAVLVFLILQRKRGLQIWKQASTGAALGVLITIGLFWLIDLNNPTASYFNSVIAPSHTAWGMSADEIDGPLDRLLFGWQGRQFQYLMFSDIPNVMPQQAADYFDNLEAEFTRPFLMLAVVGLGLLLWRTRRFGIMIIIALAAQWIFFFNYEIWDLYVFYIPSYLLIAITAAAGIGSIIFLLEEALKELNLSKLPFRIILDIGASLLVASFCIWPIFQPVEEDFGYEEISFDFDEYPEYDEYTYRVAYATVIKLPDNAIIFTEWDIMWPYYYVAHLEEGRMDLAFIEAFPADDQENLAASLVSYIEENAADRPMYFDRRISQLEGIEGLRMGPARIGPTRLFKLIMEDEG